MTRWKKGFQTDACVTERPSTLTAEDAVGRRNNRETMAGNINRSRFGGRL